MSRELKHETFADISEELRSISRSATYCEIDQPKVFGKPIAFYFAELADRIDAAELALSNMVAMRETLRQIKQMGIDLRNIIPHLDKNWEQCLKATIKIYQAAERALFEPPRNCDVGTAEEQQNRFNRFCRPCADGCPFLECRSIVECAIKWAQTPYAAEEGAGK